MQVEAKGMAKPLTLYEVRGIGGEYDLFLPEREDTLFLLHQEIPLRYTVLEGKHLGGTMSKGSFVKLSGKGGEVRSEHPVTPWSEINMRVTGYAGEEIPGDLCGKVVGKPTDARTSFSVHFMPIQPEVATFLRGLLLSSRFVNA
jgi:adenylate cyclase